MYNCYQLYYSVNLVYSSHCYKRWLQGVTILAIVMTAVWIITMVYCYKHSLPMAYAFGIALVTQVYIIMLYPVLIITVYFIYRVLLCSYFVQSASERSAIYA